MGNKEQVFEALFNWSGTQQFQVNRMSSTLVEELAELAEVQLSWAGLNGTKKKIGKWLSARDGAECVLENGRRVRLVLKRKGDGKPAAIYQLELVGSR